ncbi:MAG: polyprenyl synthetase family protein [Alphaproteobacteria bacterium]|nr:polyprenyl synthetase family protein [Alphaproteobacteria bacterium]
MTLTPVSDISVNTPSLAPLLGLVENDMARVNATIIERMHSDVPLIPQLAGHLVAAGGKRMRPMMSIAGAMMATASPDGRGPAILLATAVEFIHSATLLHDDVIDESNLRRGRDTANALWGNDAAVLVGDFLFARAFELMVEADNISVLGRLAAASSQITEGEVRQMTITGRPDTPVDDYLDVIAGKTAVLFAAAAAAGAEVSGGSPDKVAAMHDYGLQLGMAFQIMDDALDYSADAAAIGKNAGDDFVDQKITLPTIIAWQDGDADERAFWQRTLGEANFAEGDLATAQAMLAKHDAIDRSILRARGFAEAACVAITSFADDPATADLAAALCDAARFAAMRSS